MITKIFSFVILIYLVCIWYFISLNKVFKICCIMWNIFFTHSADSFRRVCSITICACVKVSDFKCASLNIPVRVVFFRICMLLLQIRYIWKVFLTKYYVCENIPQASVNCIIKERALFSELFQTLFRRSETSFALYYLGHPILWIIYKHERQVYKYLSQQTEK